MNEAPKKIWASKDSNPTGELTQYVRADLVDGLVEALEAMCEEFRLLDLPYGSEAYAKATDFLRKARGVE